MVFRMRMLTVIMAILIFQCLIYSQETTKNEITISFGASIPTSGDLSAHESGEYHRVFHTNRDGLTYQIEYSRFFKESMAISFSYWKAPFEGIRDHYWLQRDSFKFDTHSLNIGFFYHFRRSQIFSPYIGGGLNLMTTETDKEARLKVNYPSAEWISPLRHINYGPFVAGGASWNISKNVALKLEGQYVYNGYSVRKWYFRGWKVGTILEGGKKVIRINPFNLSLGVSLKW